MRLAAGAAALLLLIPASPAWAGNHESTGKAVAIALPLLAGGFSIWQGDKTGVAELTVDTLATVGTAYGLKQIVREQRMRAHLDEEHRLAPIQFPAHRLVEAFE